MSSLHLWIPKDFDKRYTIYRVKFAEKEIPKPSILDNLAKEKENLFAIKDEREYQDEMDKWKPVNVIVNEIYKELSPFKNEAQSVKIDISKLGISENISESVLMMLFDEDLCRWKLNMNPIVATSQPVREYLKGNGIIVKSYKKFKDFRFDINHFYFLLEGWKNTNFSTNQKTGNFTEKENLQENPNQNIDKKLKFNLSFSPVDATMVLTEQNGKEHTIKIQGQSQKEVLRVIFKNPQMTYTEWSLYDISDTLGPEDTNEKTVHDAIYQFNKKVQLAIPEIKNLFELTKHTAKLNLKYVNKT